MLSLPAVKEYAPFSSELSLFPKVKATYFPEVI